MQPVAFLLLLIVLVHIITGCQYSGKAANKQADFIDSLKEKVIPSSEYHISLPEDFVINVSEGPDFVVYYIAPADTTTTSPYSGGLYFGNFPNYNEVPNDSCITSDLEGKVLGDKVTWRIYQCDGTYSIQTIADSKSNEGWNSKIHLFGQADSEDGMHKLAEIYSTLKIKNY